MMITLVTEMLGIPCYGNKPVSQLVSADLFIVLCGYVWRGSLREVQEDCS